MSTPTEPRIERHCLHCKIVTAHTPTTDGNRCLLTCSVCKQVPVHLSLGEMAARLQAGLGAEPPFEISTADAKSVKVFIKHGTSDDGEAEVSFENVQQHIRIRGKLPVAGEKLMAVPKGMSHKAFAIPIGDVVRVVPVH